MKWLLLIISAISINTQAIEQFSRSECILLNHQLNDYHKRFGTRAQLYIKTRLAIKKFCHSPTVSSKSYKSVNKFTETEPQATKPKTPKKTIVVKKLTHEQAPQVFTKTALNIQEAPQTTASILNTTTEVSSSKAEGKLAPRLVTDNEPVLTPEKPPLAIVELMTLILSFWPLWLTLLLIAVLRLPMMKSKIGELYVRIYLRFSLARTEYTILNNITVPLTDGGTAQFDHIIIAKYGIFVIETKNISGRIFSNEKHKRWTKIKHNKKSSFKNPLRARHLRSNPLAELLSLPEELIHSVVIFTPVATFKNTPPVNVGHAQKMVAYVKGFNYKCFDSINIKNILTTIHGKKCKSSLATDIAHIKYLKAKKASSP